jgi:hypothetical protein
LGKDKKEEKESIDFEFDKYAKEITEEERAKETKF